MSVRTKRFCALCNVELDGYSRISERVEYQDARGNRYRTVTVRDLCRTCVAESIAQIERTGEPPRQPSLFGSEPSEGELAAGWTKRIREQIKGA